MEARQQIGWTRDWIGKLAIGLLLAAVGYAGSALQEKGELSKTVRDNAIILADHEARLRAREAQVATIEVLKEKIDNLTITINALNKRLDKLPQ